MKANKAALDELAPAMYEELRRLARHYLSGERLDHTLQPTALVHEAYLRLAGQRTADWSNRAQFLGLAASMMRRILINHARARSASKRLQSLQVETGEPATSAIPVVDLLDLNRALEALAKLDQRQEKIVELRFFAGLSIDETAEVLGVAPVTVNRDWATARLWLIHHIREAQQAAP
jgi:RNA polymerase sigma factor (TIGR02999 family)